jgi:polar amino acid transport system substrate-binding protein
MMKQYLRMVVCGMIVVGLLCSPVNAQKPTLVLNSTTKGVGLKLFQLVMQEVGTRLGFDVKVPTDLSGERAIQDANDGTADGDGLRIAGLSETFPNLIQVPEPFMEVEWTAFAKDPTITVANWADLKPYRVAYLLGWKVYENNVTEAKAVYKVNDLDALFKMLADDRIDLALFGKLEGEVYLKANKLTGIYALKPPLVAASTFLYLHKKHADLVPKIAETVRAIKADGTYQKLFDQSQIP